MRTKLTMRLVAVLAVLGLFAAACSSDDSSEAAVTTTAAPST